MKVQKKLNTVWLIDDDAATNFLHSLLIEESGMAEHIKVIESASTALDYLTGKGHSNGETQSLPDLLFLDINMPLMNGWEFLDEFQKLSKAKPQNIIIMLTASPNPDDEFKAKEYTQVTEFRKKPLTPQMLDEIMHRYFPDRCTELHSRPL